MALLTIIKVFYLDKEVRVRLGSGLTRRWPTILTGVINTIVNINHDLHQNPSADSEQKVQEGKDIISKISAMKHEMARNVHLPYA